ncbi:MAG TPA: hypothetical protein VK539_25615 [Myxococcaceae bacterium]|nr:hypothetical protein [Myxococcaceae bacterium]
MERATAARAVPAWGTLAALVAWAASLALAVRLLPPGSPWLSPYTSDSAIPVLMARAPVVDLFHAYYWGQDRFGAWPFLAARALGGTAWTAEGLQGLLLGFVWAAVLALAWRVRRGGLSGGVLALLLLVLALHPGVRPYVLELSQPYGWQFATLVGAWAGLRALAGARTGLAALVWGTVAWVPSALAVWVSASSTPVLAALTVLEAVRARARGEGPTGLRRVALALPLVLAMLFERQLRRLYHRFSEHHFHSEFRTQVSLDWGHLLDNAWQLIGRMLEGPVPLLAVLALLIAGLGVVAWRARAAVARVPESLWVAAGCGLAALAQLPVLVAVMHVRLNGYDPRYLGLAHLLAALGLGLLVLAAVERWCPPAVRRWGEYAVVAGLLGVAVLRPAPAAPEAGFVQARSAANALAAVAPGSLLVGGYWDVYTLASLQPPEATARPVPQEGDYQRTPFLVPTLRAASEWVWVQPEPEGPAEPPATRRQEHQGQWQRDAGPLLRVPGFSFWRYRSAP